MTPYLTVAGTWGLDSEWYREGSPWSRMMAGEHFAHVQCDGRPFTWTTRLNGWQFWKSSDDLDWRVAGVNLFAYVVPPIAPDRCVPPEHTHVVSHSHGLQVVLHACALGMKVNTLVDVAGPVRGDMRATARLARPNIRHWVHLYSDNSDRTQLGGQLFDGAFGIVRQHELADQNVPMPKAGHSGVLNDSQWFGVWPPVLDQVRRRDGRR